MLKAVALVAVLALGNAPEPTKAGSGADLKIDVLTPGDTAVPQTDKRHIPAAAAVDRLMEMGDDYDTRESLRDFADLLVSTQERVFPGWDARTARTAAAALRNFLVNRNRDTAFIFLNATISGTWESADPPGAVRTVSRLLQYPQRTYWNPVSWVYGRQPEEIPLFHTVGSRDSLASIAEKNTVVSDLVSRYPGASTYTDLVLDVSKDYGVEIRL